MKMGDRNWLGSLGGKEPQKIEFQKCPWFSSHEGKKETLVSCLFWVQHPCLEDIYETQTILPPADKQLWHWVLDFQGGNRSYLFFFPVSAYVLHSSSLTSSEQGKGTVALIRALRRPIRKAKLFPTGWKYEIHLWPSVEREHSKISQTEDLF